ncbi:AAA family ATPase [Clostridium sp. MT-14]|uniref:AAA family ATPase n=1 Tax=unclassified Clostridium TaxID=2614128 RepID=UPI00123C7135|nr:AAA family ATPase [Clostridium sp. HV4-5-A1G]KAA8672982.1 AAA family ATPase [Clostridium sp. HV4-5-A1G]
MNFINVKMFGNFEVTINHKKILFPYNKAQALFCYLLINKECTREKLAGLLWPDEEESIAKKNLRNAIYKIKKTLNLEVLISPRKSTVMINPDISIKSDVTDFLKNKNEINLYKDPFLTGFYVKNAENFQNWLTQYRDYLQQIYIHRLKVKISLENKNRNYDKMEDYCRLLIKVDEFDEESYRKLMCSLINNNKPNKAIETYHKLSEILNKELNVEPSKETKKLFNEILNKMGTGYVNNSSRTQKFFFGRYNELKSLRINYFKFINNIQSKSVLILGEAGIGKTKLKEKFLENVSENNVYIFETCCYQFEKEYILKPWNPIMSDLVEIIKLDKVNLPQGCENIIGSFFPQFDKNYSMDLKLIESNNNLKYEVIINAIENVFKKLGAMKKILLVFEDIQWIDSMSLSLLGSIILSENKNIILLATCRKERNEELDKFVTSMKMHNKLNIIELYRLDYRETEGFIKQALPNYNLSKKMIKKIYSETEGNLFFLTEYMNIIKSNGNINIMSSKMQDILKSRYFDISENGRKILNICSMFFDETPLYILVRLMHKDELEIMDMLEELEAKFILTEILSEDNISLKFTHQKMGEFIYSNQSLARRKILHNKIGNIFEENLSRNKEDLNTYYKLIYHFSHASNYIKELKYSMKSLNVYLSFSHELFPVLYYSNTKYSNLYFSDEKALNSLSKIEKLLNKIENQAYSKEITFLEVTFLHMKGRYLIRIGKYKEGTSIIKVMIDKAVKIKNTSYALEGYKQMIYYCIQAYNVKDMITYVNLALNIVVFEGHEDEKAVLFRLKALYNNMCGNYVEAEKLLNKSINILERNTTISDKYALNIAAAYNYIGEIRRYSMKFSQAIEYYNKAIKICERKKVVSTSAIFNINAGEAAFDMGDYALAKKYFSSSLKIYNHFDLVWGRSVAEAFMSLLKIDENEFDTALSYLKAAHTHSEMLKSPHEIGLVYSIKAAIRAKMLKDENLNCIFQKYLCEDINYYCDIGINYLKKSLDDYEINVLLKLKYKVQNRDIK